MRGMAMGVLARWETGGGDLVHQNRLRPVGICGSADSKGDEVVWNEHLRKC